MMNEEDAKRRVMRLAEQVEASMRDLHELLEGLRCKGGGCADDKPAREHPPKR